MSRGYYYNESHLNEELGSPVPSSRHINWSKFLEQMRKNTPIVIENIKKKVLNVHPKREAFQLFGVLTPEECEHLIKVTEELGYQPLSGYASSYRTNTRRIIYYEELRDILWTRVQSFLTPTLPDQFLDKIWRAYGLNPQFRFCKYEPGQHFSPHYDSNFSVSSTDKSFYTFMIYLNQVDDGGSTIFLSDSSDPPRGRPLEKLAPEAGMLLVFQHNIYHEGEALHSGLKYMMRSDVMYRLEPKDGEKQQNPSSSASQVSDEISLKRLEAIELINKAEKLEFVGEYNEAISLYKRAYKLCPELEHISKDESARDSLLLDTN